MQEIINFIVNNGIGCVCVAYLIYFQEKIMSNMLTTLSSINDRLILIESKLGIEIKEE